MTKAEGVDPSKLCHAFGEAKPIVNVVPFVTTSSFAVSRVEAIHHNQINICTRFVCPNTLCAYVHSSTLAIDLATPLSTAQVAMFTP